MPIIRIYRVSIEKIERISDELISELANGFETQEDNINIEVMNTTTFQSEANPYPIIEILAFRRNEAIETQVAQTISDMMKDLGYEYSEVFYIHLKEENYYCDGEPCA